MTTLYANQFIQRAPFRYDKIFPRYTRYKQDRPIPHWNLIARCGEAVPLYYLGWMVRVREISNYIGGYYGIDQFLVRPN